MWSDDCRLHQPGGEVWVGVRTPATEVPARANAIRAALAAAGAHEVAVERHDDRCLEAVHDPALLSFLATAWADWEGAGLRQDPGQDRVVPYIFPHPGLLGEVDALVPAATWARPGAFCFDTMTLIGPGTWEAVRAAADVALTAADLVARSRGVAYACCRPPGHHVSRRAYGGSCYLNNGAIAAARLRELADAALGHAVEHARSREQFGARLAALPAVQARLADAAMARDGLLLSAWSSADPETGFPRDSLAWAGAACREVTAHVQQVHGGIGFALEGGIHRYYRRAKSVQVWVNELLREVAGE